MLAGPVDVGVGTPSLSVTFATSPPLAWQRPSSPVQSVNEGGHSLVEGELSVCERLLIVWSGFSPPTQESGLCGCGGGVCLLVLSRLLALFVDFQCGRSKFLGEWASLRNRMVLLWECSGHSLPAQLLVH